MDNPTFGTPRVPLQETPVHSRRRDPWALLGLVRLYLASCVALSHFHNAVPSFDRWSLFFGGPQAVTVFLFISGFSIAHSLETTKKGFVARRFWRLYPIYLFSFVVAYFCDAFPLELLPGLILMGQGVWFLPPHSLGPTWTLASEWWLYMIARFANRSLVWIAVCSTAFVGVYPLLAHQGQYQLLEYGLPTLALAWAWILGHEFYIHRSPKALALFTLIYCLHHGVFAYWYSTEFSHFELGLVVNLAELGLIATFGVLLFPFKWVPKRLGNLAGNLSYPLYLVHYPIFLLAGREKWSGLTAIFLVCAASGTGLLFDHILKGLRSLSTTRSTQEVSRLDGQ